MQVSVEVLNDVDRRLTFIIPAQQVEDAYSRQMNQYGKEANIKGFRPGKAPMSVIQQRYGEEAKREAYSAVIQQAIYEALQQEKLSPLNTPQIEAKSMIADQPFEFAASFEVLPTIEKINFSLDTIEKVKVEVGEDDIKHVIEQLKKQYTKWNQVDREAGESDRLVLDYYMVFDGKPDMENKVEGFPIELGRQVMLPGFEEGLIGLKSGEEKTLSLVFPEDFPVAEKAGKPVDFVITVKQVLEAIAPTVDEAFIKQLNISSGKEEDLHKQIRQSLELERDRLLREKLKEQVFKPLLEQNDIMVPRSLIEREAKNIHDEVYPEHQPHDHHGHSEAEMSSFNEVAKKRVALGLLLSEFAKQMEIKPDADRIAQRIQEIASIYENPQEVAAWLSTDEKKAGIEAQILEDQVVDKLIESTPVTEKTISYAELKGLLV